MYAGGICVPKGNCGGRNNKLDAMCGDNCVCCKKHRHTEGGDKTGKGDHGEFTMFSVNIHFIGFPEFRNQH